MLLGSSHRVLAAQRTKNGHFSFEVRPGSYTLEARTGGTRRARTVSTRAHRTTKANVIIAIP